MAIKALLKGFTGEIETQFVQKCYLDNQRYHTYNNIIIPSRNGTTQIDHIIVSRYGIFVVETKRRNGYIYGTAEDDNWTQVFFNVKHQFQNPLRQNYLHTKSLADFLEIDHNMIHSVIVFWGNCKFRKRIPEGVCIGDHTGYIKKKKQVLLSDEEVSIICAKLLKHKQNTPFLRGWHHTISLKKRYKSTKICPKCGGNMVERTSCKGNHVGKKFLGCERYPQCRYTKEL